jgi:hypothetical protein
VEVFFGLSTVAGLVVVLALVAFVCFLGDFGITAYAYRTSPLPCKGIARYFLYGGGGNAASRASSVRNAVWSVIASSVFRSAAVRRVITFSATTTARSINNWCTYTSGRSVRRRCHSAAHALVRPSNSLMFVVSVSGIVGFNIPPYYRTPRMTQGLFRGSLLLQCGCAIGSLPFQLSERERWAVRFVYRKHGQSSRVQKHVNPYHVAYVNNQWTLFALNAKTYTDRDYERPDKST